MHSEWGRLDSQTVEVMRKAKARGGRIICVGTTSLRLVETAFHAQGALAPFEGETDIFIRPGFRFGVADMLLTNFHLPKSTLLMLVSAFAGYGHIQHLYRTPLTISTGFLAMVTDVCYHALRHMIDRALI